MLAAIGTGVAKAQCGAGECSVDSSCYFSCSCRPCRAGYYCESSGDLCSEKEVSCASTDWSRAGHDECYTVTSSNSQCGAHQWSSPTGSCYCDAGYVNGGGCDCTNPADAHSTSAHGFYGPAETAWCSVTGGRGRNSRNGQECACQRCPSGHSSHGSCSSGHRRTEGDTNYSFLDTFQPML